MYVITEQRFDQAFIFLLRSSECNHLVVSFLVRVVIFYLERRVLYVSSEICEFIVFEGYQNVTLVPRGSIKIQVTVAVLSILLPRKLKNIVQPGLQSCFVLPLVTNKRIECRECSKPKQMPRFYF